jgi:hypothetical protein
VTVLQVAEASSDPETLAYLREQLGKTEERLVALLDP